MIKIICVYRRLRKAVGISGICGIGGIFLVLSTSMYFKIIYILLVVLGLRCCAQAFSSCGERELFFVAVRRLLTTVASLAVEHRV